MIYVFIDPLPTIHGPTYTLSERLHSSLVLTMVLDFWLISKYK